MTAEINSYDGDMISEDGVGMKAEIANELL